MLPFKFSATLGLALLSAVAAHANDSMAELKTGGLSFVRTEDITMAEEDLYISPQKVRVKYSFHNNADHDVEALVAFPMPDIQAGIELNVAYEADKGDNFLGFSVRQDGVEIKPDLQQRATVAGIDFSNDLKAAGVPLVPGAAATQKALEKLPAETIEKFLRDGLVMVEEWDSGNGPEKHVLPNWGLSSVYFWRTVYPAGKDVVVEHEYNTSVGGTVDVTFLNENGEPKGEQYEDYLKRYCIDDGIIKVARKNHEHRNKTQMPLYVENWISYVLTTGNNWYGPIGHFKLTIDKGNPKNIVSFCGEGVKKTGPTTFEMQKTDFYPERDLDILLLVPPNF